MKTIKNPLLGLLFNVVFFYVVFFILSKIVGSIKYLFK